MATEPTPPRRARALTAALLALAGMLIAPAGAQAAPRPGERYDGKSATGQRIHLTVSADASRLERYILLVDGPCSNGKRGLVGLLSRGEPPVAIDAAGAFSHRSKTQRAFFDTPSGRVRGRSSTTFSGSFDASGDSVTGTIESNFRSQRFKCESGPVAFTLYRDGSAQAPFSDSVMTTGPYTASGKGLTARIRTLAPAREVVRAEIRYKARCRSRGNLRSGRVFTKYVLSDRGRRTITGQGRFRIPEDNVTVRIRYRLTFRFFAKDGYRVAGTWSVRAKVSRRGRQIDTCRFKGAFKGAAAAG